MSKITKPTKMTKGQQEKAQQNDNIGMGAKESRENVKNHGKAETLIDSSKIWNFVALDGFDEILKESHIPSFRQSAENPKIREIFSQEFGIWKTVGNVKKNNTPSVQNDERHSCKPIPLGENISKDVIPINLNNYPLNNNMWVENINEGR